MELKRTIMLRPSEVAVEDVLTAPAGVSIETIAAGDKFATIHMGSSRDSQDQELSSGSEGALDDAASALGK